MSHLAADVCHAPRKDEHPGPAAIFICGDRGPWREDVLNSRLLYPSAFLIVTTRVPDHEKWLDALEAGADDYCCLPFDRQQLEWFLQSVSLKAAVT